MAAPVAAHPRRPIRNNMVLRQNRIQQRQRRTRNQLPGHIPPRLRTHLLNPARAGERGGGKGSSTAPRRPQHPVPDSSSNPRISRQLTINHPYLPGITIPEKTEKLPPILLQINTNPEQRNPLRRHRKPYISRTRLNGRPLIGTNRKNRSLRSIMRILQPRTLRCPPLTLCSIHNNIRQNTLQHFQRNGASPQQHRHRTRTIHNSRLKPDITWLTPKHTLNLPVKILIHRLPARSTRQPRKISRRSSHRAAAPTQKLPRNPVRRPPHPHSIKPSRNRIRHPTTLLQHKRQRPRKKPVNQHPGIRVDLPGNLTQLLNRVNMNNQRIIPRPPLRTKNLINSLSTANPRTKPVHRLCRKSNHPPRIKKIRGNPG